MRRTLVTSIQSVRLKRQLFVLILAFLVAVPLSGEEYPFTHLSMEDGLSNNSVFSIIQDSFGFMWMATFSGLNRYDGNEFVVYKPQAENPYSISSSLVFALLEDSKGELWVGTDGGGLNRFDRGKQEFSCLRHDPQDPNSISGDQVFALAEDRLGWIWVGTGGSGLNRYDRVRRKFRHYRRSPGNPTALQSDVIRCIFEDSAGRLWIGTAGGGLSRYERGPDTFTTWRHDPDNPHTLGSDTVRAIYEDSCGRLWIGTQEGGFSLYHPESDTFTTWRHDPDNPDSFHGQTVRNIAEDPEGRLWLGTETNGIGLFDPRTETFTHISGSGSSPNGLFGDKIRAITVDRGGLVWVGTRDGGINIYNPRSRNFSLISSNHPCRQIYEDSQGTIWFGTDGGGLTRFEPASGRFTTFRHDPADPRSLSSDIVYCICEDGDILWVGTDGGGLNAFDPATGRCRRYLAHPDDPGSIGSNVIWALFRDTDGTLWVGTEGGGLNRLERDTDTFKHYCFEPHNEHSLNGNSVRTIFRDSRGVLWIGTWDGGLSRYRTESDDFLQLKRDPANPSSLGDNSVNCIFEDRDGVLWVGTAGSGLNRLYGNTDHFAHFTRTEGLAGDNVFGILQDEQGYLWISTDNGLSRFDPHAQEFANFSEADGLQKTEFSQNAFCRARDGTLYFGGPNGINAFHPATARRNPNVPLVQITGIRILDRPILLGPGRDGYLLRQNGQPASSRLKLGYRDLMVGFSFAVLDYTAPHRNQYAIKIEGLRDEWTYLGNQHTAVVTNLRPGRYVLRVKGANNNGLWNETGTSLDIVVYPPFWGTLLFRLGFGLGLGLAAFGVYMERTRRLRRRAGQLLAFSRHIQNAREEERKAAAREVHDELGQYLSALKMHLHWTAGHLDADPELLDETVQSALELADLTLESVKSISTKLRPKVLDNLSLPEAIEWQAGDFERRTGIRCLLDIQPMDRLPNQDLATGLFRIFQEILTNILRHSGAGRVEVKFHTSDGFLKLKVADDGRGIRDEELRREDSFGILGMQERCSYLGGSMSIKGVPGRGTRITVTLPLKNVVEEGPGSAREEDGC